MPPPISTASKAVARTHSAWLGDDPDDSDGSGDEEPGGDGGSDGEDMNGREEAGEARCVGLERIADDRSGAADSLPTGRSVCVLEEKVELKGLLTAECAQQHVIGQLVFQRQVRDKGRRLAGRLDRRGDDRLFD